MEVTTDTRATGRVGWHPGPMRYSEFRELVVDVFGPALGPALVADQVLGPLDDRTAAQALDAGEDPRRVWRALCDAMDVPEADRLGPRERAPRRGGR